MKFIRIIILAMLVLGCSTASNVQTCPQPTIDSVIEIKNDTVVKTITRTVVDTMQLPPITHLEFIHDTIPAPMNIQLTSNDIVLLPDSSGDSYPQDQAAIDYCQGIGNGLRVVLVGHHVGSKGLLAAYPGSVAYLNITGTCDAKDPIYGQASEYKCYNCQFGIATQSCKSCSITNLVISGGYIGLDNFSEIQIDTLSWPQGWQYGGYSMNASSPYAGILVDPFSDPIYFTGPNKMYAGYSQYYVSGMDRSGSTAVTISGCYVQNFVVGIMLSPAHQLNCEMVNVEHTQLSYDAIGYACTQAQQKQNRITDLESWGWMYCVVDCDRFGIRNGDGVIAPIIDGINGAGYINELTDCNSTSFPLNWANIYYEGLYRLGYINTYAGQCTHCVFDFQQDAAPNDYSVPNPGNFGFIQGMDFYNSTFRIYDGDGQFNRLPFFGYGNTFHGGFFGAPPIWGPWDQGTANEPIFDYARTYYIGSPMNGSPTWNSYTPLGNFMVHPTPGFEGYITGMSGVDSGDVLLATHYTRDYYHQLVTTWDVGHPVHVSGDTVYMAHMNPDIADTIYSLTVSKLKIAN